MERNDKEYIEELLGELQDSGVELYRLHKVVRVVKQWREQVKDEMSIPHDHPIYILLAEAYDHYIKTRG